MRKIDIKSPHKVPKDVQARNTSFSSKPVGRLVLYGYVSMVIFNDHRKEDV
uniref:Uncharacterized protein n=1 Tax=Arundo donax TaxID=35708 RepID=A0A0A9FIC5_ARUDO